MRGAYWYGGLVIVSLFLLLVALWHKKEYKLLILHLAVAGTIHPFEVLVINFKAYRYMPGIMPGIGDNILGAYASDLFIVPATTVVISAFSLSWRSRILFAVAFTFIDWYFTVIGIYEHYWWKSIYTGIGIIILYDIRAMARSPIDQPTSSISPSCDLSFLRFPSHFYQLSC